jgi:acyl-CoA synthetase (NDP forming)
VGSVLLSNLQSYGFQGPVYPVGLHGGRIGDLEIAKSVLDISQPIDLAAVLVPAQAVTSVLEECGQAGVKWAIIMTAGFSEYSEDHKDLEEQIKDVAQKHRMRLVGPNCIGILNSDNRLAGTFIPLRFEWLRDGPVGIAAQSGSVVQEMAMQSSLHKVGFSKCISLGNKLTTNEVAALKYLTEDDSNTEQVTLYLEGLSDGRGLFEQAKKSQKPIVLLKSNIIPGGNAAARSHTAALASDERIVDAACRQANLVRAHNLAELLSYTKALALPPMRGDNVGIVVNSGGAGVVISDHCHLKGLIVPPLPQEEAANLANEARTHAIRRGNPMDTGDTYNNALALHAVETFLRQDDIHGVFLCISHPEVQFSGPSAVDMLNQCWDLSLKWRKPVAISFQPLMAPLDGLREKLDFPIFDRPEESVAALAMSRDYWQRRRRTMDPNPEFNVDRQRVAQIIAEAQQTGMSELADSATDILAAYGIPHEPIEVAASADEAGAIANRLGYPVALKIRSPQISHKTDVGGVELDIASETQVRESFERITTQAGVKKPAAQILGVSVQRMVSGGREIIIGAKRDQQFGPVIMFGLGGVQVELFEDVSFRLAPLSRQDALEMLNEVKSSQLLRGFRGEAPSDMEAIVNVMLRLSQLVSDFPQIAEIDLNPVKVFEAGLLPAGQGCRAVDARILLQASGRPSNSSFSTKSDPITNHDTANGGAH